MRYAVEARIFDNGKIIVRVRPAAEGEEDSYTEMRTCEVWVDIFESRADAEVFARDYKRG